MKILALSPHTDDAEIGAGASLARLVDEGHEVLMCALSTGSQETGATESEFEASGRVLGVIRELLFFTARNFQQSRQEILQRMIDTYADWPDLVIGPSPNDRHQDHQVVAAETIRAFPCCSILAYEAKGTTDQVLNYYVKVERAHVNRKIAAAQCYESQAGRSYVAADYLESLARVRGVECGAEFAEAFEVVRWIE